MKKIFAFVFMSFILSSAQAADLSSLITLYRQSFFTLYQPRFCGENIRRFLLEANRRRIDTSGAVVAKLEGGFWEVRGFSARARMGEDELLGNFHVFLVAEGHVFDFDFTSQPKVLPLHDYLVEMYAPPSSEYRSKLRGQYRFLDDFPQWRVTLRNASDYTGGTSPQALATKKIREWADPAELQRALARKWSLR